MPARAITSAETAHDGRINESGSAPPARPTVNAPLAAGPFRVKICGIGKTEDIRAAADSGAHYVGFVFYPPSPRSLGIDRAATLAAAVPEGVERVALFVDPEDELLDAVLTRVAVEHIQLHGSETPSRGIEIRRRTGKRVIKAVRFRNRDSLSAIGEAEEWADQVLCDALPASGEPLPGGNGIPFDWRLIQGREWTRPWLLAGGLTAENVDEAVRLTGARQVDVSSGVESLPGQKDPERIAAFLRATIPSSYAPHGRTP